MLTLYRLLLPALHLALRGIAHFSESISEFLAGREGLLERWRRADLGPRRIWFHVSSVGELEQVRPVLEVLAAKGEFSLVLSYYSPSVPRLVKDWSFVRYADYLPLDFPGQMEELVSIVRPELLVLNRYDLWPHHLQAAKRAHVPVFLVNASTPPLGFFGYLSLALRRSLFLAIDAWTFVDTAAANAWEPYMIDRARGLVAGNPRVDRAIARVERAVLAGKAKEKLALWKRTGFCLVAGSTWEKDEELILSAWKKRGSLVIVPHEPTSEHVAHLEKLIARHGLSFVRLSSLERESHADVLVVDQRGFLAEIYALGDVAFVGGGFGKQIHSIIEPIAHGLPVAFGPKFDRSPEALTLVAAGVGFSTKSPFALADWFSEMEKSGFAKNRAQENLKVFVQIHRGAGERVAEFLLASKNRVS